MAKRRLNKKVAVLGMAVLVLLLVAAAFMYTKTRKNPQKLLAQAQMQFQAIETMLERYHAASTGGPTEQSEKLLREGQDAYVAMLNMYRQAAGSARNDDFRIEVLFSLADADLRHNAFHTPDWGRAMRSWNQIVTLRPGNLKARKSLLQFYYDSADSGQRGAWPHVKEHTNEIALQPEVPADDRVYARKAAARADLEMASAGEVPNPLDTADKAIAQFQSLLEEFPGDVELSRYLSNAIMLKGHLRESIDRDAPDRAFEQALAVLEQAVNAAPQDVNAHVNLLNLKLAGARGQTDEIKALEPRFDALIAAFPASAEAHAARSTFFQVSDQFDDALAAIARAVQLDTQSVNYAASLAALYYRKASIEKNNDLLRQAIETAEAALTLPDAQDVQGPRRQTFMQNRAALHAFLARISIEQALEAKQTGADAQHQAWVEKTSVSVSQLMHIFGSQTNVYAMMWDAMFGMARGDDPTALPRMFDAYEQFKAANRNEPFLAYMLARAMQGSPEIGSRMQFLRDAISGGIAAGKPDLFLDYADLLLQLRAWTGAGAFAENYETVLGATSRSKSLRARSFIGAGQFEQASQILEQMDGRETQVRGLQLDLLDARILRSLQIQADQQLQEAAKRQLDEDLSRRAVLTAELLAERDGDVKFQTVVNVCSQFLGENAPRKAAELVAAFVAKHPDHSDAKIYQRQIMSPDLMQVTSEQRDQIALEVLGEIGDELQRSVALGQYYLRTNRFDQAAASYSRAMQINPDDSRAVEGLFETILAGLPDRLDQARALAEKARHLNLDGCQGEFYMARLARAAGEHSKALDRLDKCLKARPIYAHAYLLRSQIHSDSNDHEQCLRDAQTAADMNPLDPAIARWRAEVLLARHTRLGAAVTAVQREQTEDALRYAVVLNPLDWSLQSRYAEYRSDAYPEESLAQRQFLAKRFPVLENFVLLGDMAKRMAMRAPDGQKRSALLEIAQSAFDTAWEMAPEHPVVQQQYSEFLRATGQHAKVETLFSGREDVLWRYYLRDGRYDQARNILASLYAKDAKDPAIVRGLAVVAQKTNDRKNTVRFAEELLAIEDSIDNQFHQVQAYVDVGLIREAELKLAAFRERHPREPRGMLFDGLVMMLRGRLDEALAMINGTLEVSPDNSQAWRLRGRVNRLKGDYAQAVEDLLRGKSFGPDAEISMELAQAYRQTNQMTAALGELRSAAAGELVPMRVWMLLEQFLGDDPRQKGELRKFYDEVLAKYPESEYWHYRAVGFYLQEKDLARAELLATAGWEAGAKKGRPSGALFDMYLETLFLRDKHEKVLEIASRNIDGDLASIAYAWMGQTQARRGNRDVAIQHYHRSLEKCGSDDARITAVLSRMSAAVGADEVEKWAASRLVAAPNSLAANMVMFNLALQKSQYNTALAHLDKARGALSPDDPLRTHYVGLRAGAFVQAWLKTGDGEYLRNALEQYEAVIAEQPHNVNALNNMAYLMADSAGRLDEARNYAARAHAADPDNANTMDTYAYVLCKNKEYEKAREMLQRAIQLYDLDARPVPMDVYKHLGMALEGLSMNEPAAEAYRSALKIGGQSLAPREKDALEEALRRVSVNL